MSKVWTEHLTSGEVNVLNSFIEQVPETMGAREAIVNIVQKLADSTAGADDEVKYLVAGEGDVRIVKTEEKAREYAGDPDYYVVNLTKMTWYPSEDEDEDTELTEE